MRLQLELARLAAFYEHGDIIAARNLVQDLSRDHELRHYKPSDYMDIAEYNAVLGFREGLVMLDGKDISTWPARDQSRAVALMGRLLPVSRNW